MNNLNLEHLKSQAKDLLKAWKAGEPAAALRCSSLPAQNLASVQWLLAQELGFATWPALKAELDLRDLSRREAASLAPSWVNLCLGFQFTRPKRAKAAALLERVPSLAQAGLGHAALAGDYALVQRAVGEDGSLVHSLHTHRSIPLLSLAAASVGTEDEALKTVGLLLEMGADPNQQFREAPFEDWPLAPLYFAAGIAGSPKMIRLLIEAGASPNDWESLYHSMEHPDSGPMEAMLAGGAAWTKTNAFPRLLDYEDPARIRRALDLGAPLEEGLQGGALHHALTRGRSLPVLQLLVERGADLRRQDQRGRTPYALAARLGRADFTGWLEARGVREELSEKDLFIAACARGDSEAARRLQGGFVPADPEDLALPADLAGIGQAQGVRLMVEMGWPPDSRSGQIGTISNHAAFAGDADLLAWLMAHGAAWTEKNGYGGDVWGSIYWASLNIPEQGDPGRHVRCARALLEAGSPVPDRLDGGDDVRAFLESWLEDHPEWPRAELS